MKEKKYVILKSDSRVWGKGEGPVSDVSSSLSRSRCRSQNPRPVLRGKLRAVNSTQKAVTSDLCESKVTLQGASSKVIGSLGRLNAIQ